MIVLFAIISYTPASEENTTLVETGFASYAVDGGELCLHTPGGETYKIDVYKCYDGIFEDPATLCDGNTYRIWVNDHGSIKAMEDGQGQQYITFDSEREAYRRSQAGGDVLLLAFWLFSIALFVLSLVVSKNPERAPAWLVKILLKDRFSS